MAEVGRYGAQTDLVEFIYGITFEIWEEKGVELIREYYADDIEFFALSGVSYGVESVVQGTYDTLRAFPDRLLLPENVVWSDDADGRYSSHRILSPMTNLGASAYGPATNKKIHVRTIADCLVHDGKIVREWLIRDTLPIVQQLGFDPISAASDVADGATEQTLAWLSSERSRVAQAVDVDDPWALFARRVLVAMFETGDLEPVFPHYTVLYPNPTDIVSGLAELEQYAAQLRASFGEAQLCVDHVAAQPWAREGTELAVRWTVSAKHTGPYLGVDATGREVLILGCSHWRVLDEKVVTSWTVFDGIGVLAQLV